jgi:excisionase family DNA binding protein
MIEMKDATTLPETLFYTVREAAARLHVCHKSIYRLLDRGLLHSSKAFRKKLIPREEVEAFFDTTQ